MAILTREQFRLNKLDIGGADPAVESLWLSVTGPGRRTVIVGVIYRPPGSSTARGLELIEEQLRAATATGKPLVVLGDFNFDMLDDSKPGTRDFKRIINDVNLMQLVEEPTHIHPTPTLLDLILTNLTDLQSSARVLPEPVADHQPVTFSAPVGRQRRPRPAPVTTRPWGRMDWDAFCLRLLTADWERLYSTAAVDGKLAAFMGVWSAAVDELCPVVTVSRRRPDCPWLRDNPDIDTAMEERDTARRTWRRSRSAEARRDYQLSRNRLKGLLARAKREFLCNDLLTDRRGFWSRIKSFALRPAGAAPASSADDVTRRADEFNAHFASVGPRVAADVARSGGADVGPRPPCVCASALVLGPVTLPELSEAISSMSSSRAVGVDGVPLFAIVRSFAVIGPHLLHIINHSISSSVFPSAWKLARVIPVHKSGDTSDPSNYRPISILSALSKIMEKVVSRQLVSYLVKNNVLSPHQYAYRPCHSTEDAVLDAVHWISTQIDAGRVASLTTLDLSKAFDSVDHGVLLDKLEWYGVSSMWFRSYLHDRRQVVTGGSSDPLPLTHGVAQGSILGPILFLILINDLPCFLTHGRLLSYADDTQLLDHSLPTTPDLSQLRCRVEQSIFDLQLWFQANSLKMNQNKTFITLIGTQQTLKKTESFYVSLSGNDIRPSQTVKILGVLLDRHLTWDPHITMVVRRCNSILASLYKIRHHFTPDVLKLLVQAHVFPHIQYCLSVWGGAAKCQMQRVQKTMNFAARLVTGVRRSEHISPALESLGWERVDVMLRRHDHAHVQRALYNDQCPPTMSAMFTRRAEVSSRDTRAVAAGKLQLPKWRLARTQREFAYRAAASWNAKDTATGT